MVICCAAVNCSNRQGKGEKRAVSFHRFPLKDSKRLIQWLKAVQRDNWTPTKYSFLCSEHFTKDSFSKRLEDQHRLLKPTAVPSIFHLAEKKKSARSHVRSRRKEADQPPGDVREQQEEAEGEVDKRPLLAVDEEPIAKEEVGKMERAASQSEQEAERPTLLEGSPRTSADSLATEPRVPREPARPSLGSCTETRAQAEAWDTDKSGISIDDFTPPGSGACKFIGSLHSYSFSSRHTRERPSLPKEPLDRKRLKRDMEAGCSRGSVGPGTCLAEGSRTSSLTATPQKPSQSSSAPPPDVTPKPATEAVLGQKGDTDANPMSINEVIMSASGACKLIDSLHSYCFSSRQNKSQVCCLREQVEKKNGELKLLRQRISRSDNQVKKLREKLEEVRRLTLPYPDGLIAPDCETPKMNPIIEPLSWMLGTWLSEPPGDGIYPTLQPFNYLEEVHITHVGQPMLNFSFNAFHPDTKKPMHRECGFIRLKPNSNKVAFVSAQNTGIVEVEEGEVNGQELCIASHSIARISFAAEPRVEQIMRKFRLNAEGRLEQTVSMATTTQPMTQHLHITYKKVTP
ncbi:peroxynitrite isomerase THAP4 isoform X1 [Dromiciops gliroides]|uniref:peroxynitrite isomerase THAP4 isoform X1 n=1 Tax=Dromiciops gliroides TaxID=33562 RepID=UPI001CC5F616|nr:peroxynitrite isomerase THAP4 isoform X1 [Dromiciops gliroides]